MTLTQTTRYAEYLMPDGSPRFGIRTGPSDAAPGPVAVPAQTNGGQAAAQANLMTAPQLKNAASYRFVLDGFGADEEIIADLRANHPKQLATATALVVGQLGSPRKWIEASQRRFTDTVVERGVDPRRTLRALTAYLALSVIPLLAFASAVLLELPDWATLAVAVFATLGLKPAMRKVLRNARGAIIGKVGPEDRRMLWDDVVNATLLEVLADKGIAVDPVTAHAARRRFKHIRYAAHLTEQLLDEPV